MEGQFKFNTEMFAKHLPKFAEKSPVKYALTLHLSSLSTAQIHSISDELLVKRFKKLLETLFDSLLIPAKVANCSKVQYTIDSSFQNGKR